MDVLHTLPGWIKVTNYYGNGPVYINVYHIHGVCENPGDEDCTLITDGEQDSWSVLESVEEVIEAIGSAIQVQRQMEAEEDF